MLFNKLIFQLKINQKFLNFNFQGKWYMIWIVHTLRLIFPTELDSKI
ncbi:hypothetical protein BH11BAC5_BH11BAC5_20450 [soil metagenome]